jgi:hypothetical protein
MFKEKRRVVFADKALETDFRRLEASKHPEDKHLHSVLAGIRAELDKRWRRGKGVAGRSVLAAYERIHGGSNLWMLRLRRHGTVIYRIDRDEIHILDIV